MKIDIEQVTRDAAGFCGRFYVADEGGGEEEIDPDALIDSPDELIANLREMREFLIRKELRSMIEVRNMNVSGLAVDETCNSGNEEHSGPAIVTLFIGDPDLDGSPAAHLLCEKCATKTLVAFAYILGSATGKSVAECLGARRPRAKR